MPTTTLTIESDARGSRQQDQSPPTSAKNMTGKPPISSTGGPLSISSENPDDGIKKMLVLNVHGLVCIFELFRDNSAIRDERLMYFLSIQKRQ